MNQQDYETQSLTYLRSIASSLNSLMTLIIVFIILGFLCGGCAVFSTVLGVS